jgi:hypothetical protein
MRHTAARCGAWSASERPDEAKVRIPGLPSAEALAIQHVRLGASREDQGERSLGNRLERCLDQRPDRRQPGSGSQVQARRGGGWVGDERAVWTRDGHLVSAPQLVMDPHAGRSGCNAGDEQGDQPVRARRVGDRIRARRDLTHRIFQQHVFAGAVVHRLVHRLQPHLDDCSGAVLDGDHPVRRLVTLGNRHGAETPVRHHGPASAGSPSRRSSVTTTALLCSRSRAA